MPVNLSRSESMCVQCTFSLFSHLTDQQVSRLVRENLTDRALRFNLVLEDVSITHVAFSTEFTHAVEAKQVAQQTALRAAFLVDQAIQEKQVCVLTLSRLLSYQHGYLCLQSIIVRAQGEAQSAELIGESLRKNKGFLELRRLEAARDIATILSQSQNKVMLDSQSLLLNGEHLGSSYNQNLTFCLRCSCWK